MADKLLDYERVEASRDPLRLLREMADEIRQTTTDWADVQLSAISAESARNGNKKE